MSHRIKFLLVPSFKAWVRAKVDGVTAADFAALDRLIAEDRFLGRNGRAHPDFIAWVVAIRDRESGAGVAHPARAVLA